MKKVVLLNCLILLCVFACSTRSPEAVLEEFYNYNEPDSESLDPLILAGEKVVPLVMERVQDRNTQRRRLAIQFLGNSSYKQALPVLEKIMKDETEESHFRSTALISIFKIDEKLVKQFAQQYKVSKNDLGDIARDILANKDYLNYRRTYTDALLRRHD
jgi:HEAT repeat protein